MQVILNSIGQVITILNTRKRKSLLFILPLMLPSIGIIVVMLPLIGLKYNIIRRLNYIGLRYKVQEYIEDKKVRYLLVFVLVNKAVSVMFQFYLNRLKAGNRLNRVIFNKSYLAITISQYQPKIKLVKYLRSLQYQFIYLTAILPLIIVNWFKQAILLYQPYIIQSLTVHTDLKYWVRRSSIIKLQDFTLAEIRAILQKGWFL